MKKKIFLLLASSALLASCTLPGASSSGGIFSSDANTSAQGTTSGGAASTGTPVNYETTTREKGVQAMSDALAVTLKQDKIGVSGNVKATGEMKGALGMTQVGSSVEKFYVEAEADIDYHVDVVVNGLTTTDPFQAAIQIQGQHELSESANGEKIELQGGGFAGFYATDGNAYYDVESGMSEVLNLLIGYPYGDGRWVDENALSGMPSPLLDEATAKEAVEGFTKDVNEFMDAYGAYITFGASGTAYQAKAVLDAKALAKLSVELKEVSVDVAYVLEMISKATLDESVLTFEYDTSVGFRSLYFGFDGELKGAMKDVFPAEAEVPEALADEIFEADVDIGLGLAVDYGRSVELPDDLDTYKPISEASSQGGGSQVPVGKEVSPEELIDFLAGYEDIDFRAVTMRDTGTFDTVASANYGDDEFNNYYGSPIWHLTETGIRSLEEIGQTEFYIVDSAVEAFITIQIDENTVHNYRVIYGEQYNYRFATYADVNVRVSGVESQQSVFIEWYYEPQAKELGDAAFKDFVAEYGRDVTATALTITGDDGSVTSITNQDEKWEEVLASYKYHLTSNNVEMELMPEIFENEYDYYSFQLNADGDELSVIFCEYPDEDYYIYGYNYDVDDGLTIESSFVIHVVDMAQDNATSHTYHYEWDD